MQHMTNTTHVAVIEGSRREAAVTPVPNTLLDVSHVDVRTAAAAVAISISYFLQLVREGAAPAPLRFGSRCTRWKLSDVRSWLEQRAEKGAADTASAQAVTQRAKKASDAAR